MPADPAAAGRKGGASKSPAKVAAARRNGFQKVNPVPATPTPAPEERRQPVPFCDTESRRVNAD